jgi:hypothetical protein
MDIGTILVSALVSVVSSSITAYVTFRFSLRQERVKWERALSEKIVQLQTENTEHATRLLRQYASGYLVVTSPGTPKREKVFLPATGRLAIGTSPDNDVVLQDRAASRHHAVIEVNDRGTSLTDLHTTVGTFVNGHRMPDGGRVKLAHEDVVRIGKAQMTYMRMSEGK